MALATKFTRNRNHLFSVNSCRIWLQITTVAERADTDGSRLIPTAVSGESDENNNPNLWQITNSALTWPQQERPTDRAGNTWRRFLQQLTDKNTNLLRQPLGCWTSNWQRHRKWRFYTNKQQTTVQHHRKDGSKSQNVLTRRSTNCTQRYEMDNITIEAPNIDLPIIHSSLHQDHIIISSNSLTYKWTHMSIQPAPLPTIATGVQSM
jgi:hypothetical protein